MKTMEEIRADYERTNIDDELIQESGYERVYVMKNESKRKKLIKEAESLLPKNKKLAIYLHSKMCKGNHTDYCSWFYEINGVDHDWTRFAHED